MKLTEHVTAMLNAAGGNLEDFLNAKDSLYEACKEAEDDRAQLIGSEYTLRLAIKAIHALYDCIMARDHLLEPDEQEACEQAETLFHVEETMNRVEAGK